MQDAAWIRGGDSVFVGAHGCALVECHLGTLTILRDTNHDTKGCISMLRDTLNLGVSIKAFLPSPGFLKTMSMAWVSLQIQLRGEFVKL